MKIDDIRIVLTSVDIEEGNGRKVSELLEGTILSKEDLYNLKADVYSLSDFVDLCNDQCFNVDEYWVTYVIIKENI